jgi:hypothetical protein
MYSPKGCRNNVMKFLLSLFVAVILVVGIAQAETPSSKAFTEAAAAAARAAIPSAQVTVNGDLHPGDTQRSRRGDHAAQRL